MVIFKNKKKFVFVLFFVIAASAIFLLTTVNPNRFETQCNSSFEYRNNSKGLVLPITATLVLRRNATGFLDMSGFFSLNDEKLIVSRVITFNYSKENLNLYRISNITSDKSKIDNVDDDFLSSSFFSAGTGRERFMSALRVKNTLMIGNSHSPVFVCVLR